MQHSPKIHYMKQIDKVHVGEETTMAAIVTILYFSAILLFAYVFTLT